MMDRIAQASREDRAELFRGSAAILRPKRSPAIIEKDFWVCWTLRRIYEILQYRPQLIFKGGTSLWPPRAGRMPWMPEGLSGRKLPSCILRIPTRIGETNRCRKCVPSKVPFSGRAESSIEPI